jgi:hypothetical protein
LTQGAELKHRVVQGGLSFQQNASQLQDDAEPKCQRHRHRPHLLGRQGVGVDEHFGLTASESGHLDRVLEPLCGAYPGEPLGRRAERKPDAFTLKTADQRDAATLKQLSLGSREPTGCCEGAW